MGVPISDVNFKKSSCRAVDFKNVSCRYVHFKEVLCRITQRLKKRCVALSI